MSEAMLAASGLSKVYVRGFFSAGPRRVTAFRDVELSIGKGSLFGLIGESGSGKSSLARVLLGMERATKGSVRYEGRELCSLPRAEARRILRGAQMVYQDASCTLDPLMTVGDSMVEALSAAGAARSRYAEETESLFRSVRLDPGLARRKPRDLSGGQRQRVVIARALALRPSLLVLDEPVSSLDLSAQAAIVDLLLELKERLDMTYLLVSHDLALVASVCDRIAVMKDGRIIESGATEEVLASPAHPYTRKLRDSSLPTL